MSSHSPQPTAAQLKPMVEHSQSFWSGFTKFVAVGVVAIIVLLAAMAAFLVKHPQV